jgi:hypothetical protein
VCAGKDVFTCTHGFPYTHNVTLTAHMALHHMRLYCIVWTYEWWWNGGLEIVRRNMRYWLGSAQEVLWLARGWDTLVDALDLMYRL